MGCRDIIDNTIPHVAQPEPMNVDGHITKYWEALAQLHLVGGSPPPGDSGYVAYGLRIAGSIEALSLTVRNHGGVVYEDTTNAGHVVVVLPLHVPLQALGQSLTNTKGQVQILDACAYGPPA